MLHSESTGPEHLPYKLDHCIFSGHILGNRISLSEQTGAGPVSREEKGSSELVRL